MVSILRVLHLSHLHLPQRSCRENAYPFEFCNAICFEIILGLPLLLYAQSLGAGAAVCGALAGMVYALSPLQLICAARARRVGFKKWITVGWIARTLLILSPVGLAIATARDLVDEQFALHLLIGTMFLFCAALNAASCAWLPWITELVPDSAKSRFLVWERSSIYMGGFFTMGATVALLSLSENVHFAPVFLVSFAGGMAATWFLRRMPDAVARVDAHIPIPSIPWRTVITDRRLLFFIGMNAAWILGQASLPVHGALYFGAHSQLSEMSILAAVLWFYVGALGGLQAGRISLARYSNGWLRQMRLCAVIALIASASWCGVVFSLLEPTYALRAFLWCASGFAVVGFQLPYLRELMCRVPMDSSRHFAVNATVENLALWTTPIAWGLVIDFQPFTSWSVTGFQAYFLAATTVVGIFTLCLFSRNLREVPAQNIVPTGES